MVPKYRLNSTVLALNCSRPIIYESPDINDEWDDDYPYWMKGTCFLLGAAGRIYIVTARHVLKNQVLYGDNAELKNQVRIPYFDGSDTFLPIERYISVQGEEEAYKDIALFRVAMPNLKDELIKQGYVHIIDDVYTAVRKPLPIRQNLELVVRGYPSQLNYIDYEKRTINPQALVLGGRLSGANMLQFVYRLSWHSDLLHLVETDSNVVGRFCPDGLSGSPVFCAGTSCLIGILIMGSRCMAHFLDSRIIYRAIEMAIQQESKEIL
jgi:hypothetical protein